MRWLVLCSAKAAPGEVQALLGAASARIVPGAEWIPMNGQEMTIEVEGPADLPARIEGQAGIMAVYPSNEPTAY